MTYREFVEKMNKQMREDFSSKMKNGDYEEARKLILKMIRCKFIVEGDALISEKSLSVFRDNGEVCICDDVEKALRYSPETPENPVFGLGDNFQIKVKSEEHWGKRVELVYQGDIIVPAKEYKYDVAVKKTREQSIGVLKEMNKMCMKLNDTCAFSEKQTKIIEREAGNGHMQFIDVRLSNGQSFKLRNLGFSIVALGGKNDVNIMSVIDYEEMIKLHISVKDTFNKLMDNITRNILASEISNDSINKVNIIPLFDKDKVIERQEKLYKDNPTRTMEKFVEEENLKMREKKEAVKVVKG